MKTTMNSKCLAISLAMCTALFFHFTITGCKAKRVQSNAWHVPSDEYAFFEYYQINEGKAIEGVAPPAMRIDGPTYSYNTTEGELNSFLTPAFGKDSLIAVLGRGLVLRGTEGGGLHNRLFPIKNLPYTEEDMTVEVISADPVQLTVRGEKVMLLKGQEWENVNHSIDTLFLPEGNVVIEKTRTTRVVYHGLLKKDKLIFR